MLLTVLPAAAQQHVLDYGPRTAKRANPTDEAQDNNKDQSNSEPSAWMRTLATIGPYLQVPHSWFISFYVFYLVCSASWATQWWTWSQALPGSRGADNLLGRIVARQQAADIGTAATSMHLAQVYVAFALEMLQTGRRSYEYLCVFRPSKAKMNVAHFLMGFLYYAIMSVAVWVEGSQEIMSAKQRGYEQTSYLDKETLAKIVVGTALFLLAWTGQFLCHVQLSGLKKYSMPEEGLFRYLISPHYTEPGSDGRPHQEMV
ncbi:hypothetical protein SEPCBS57363_003427 [Sporothrix epigloea]|uniref:Polyprenal reductase n=1 Tax=Sporothrix epigloea TaxID=1892477 RepID=A0ABP0DLE4_9PEZI